MPHSSPDRLRVLIDATPLGFAADPGVGRAGIFRAAQGFVDAALARTDLDVAIAGVDSFFAEAQLSRYFRGRHATLTARRIAAWQHPSTSIDELAQVLDSASAAGEQTAEGRRLMATAALINRVARPVPPLGPFDIYQTLRHALAGDDRIRARARVLFVHDLIPLRFPALAGEGFDRALQRILDSLDPLRDWVLCASESTRQDVLAHVPIDPSRVFVVPLAADPTLFHPVDDEAAITHVRDRYGLGGNPFVLSVCTFEPRKNLAHLIRAFADLASTAGGTDLHLALVGAVGWKSDAIFETLHALPATVRARIKLLGQVADDDLAPLYSAADAFVYPSVYEGFGLPVLEAMQCGAPVVTTTGGSLPEVAGDAARLVDPHDREALVAAMAEARSNAALSTAGRARAAQFTWIRTVDLTVAAWRFMLSAS